MNDAIRYKCKTCPYFHQPQDGPIGACVLYPPTPFIVGMAPVGPVIDPTKPANVAPIIQGSYPKMNQEEGCWQHPEAQREIQAQRMKSLN